jgi:hypothetical protein
MTTTMMMMMMMISLTILMLMTTMMTMMLIGCDSLSNDVEMLTGNPLTLALAIGTAEAVVIEMYMALSTDAFRSLTAR